MHPQERELLVNFLDRLARIPPQATDPEADAIIRQSVRRPDAVYLLVQQALVQEIGLQQAEHRIQALEQELQAARAAASSGAAPIRGGFLGGLLGGGGGQRRGWSDAPVTPPAGSGWGRGPSSFAPPMAAAPVAQSGGGVGGFLATAAATAAGVAGGALLFEGVKNLMGGESNTGGNFDTSSGFTPGNSQNVTSADADDSSFFSSGDADSGSGWDDSGGGSDWS